MATITATPDLTRMRVGVQVDGSGADAITVERVHADGTAYPVRGMEAVSPSAGQAFAYDYEAPIAEAFTYRLVVDVGSEVVRENQATRPSPTGTGLPWTWQTGTGGAGTTTRVTGDGRPYLRRTVTTADTGGNSGPIYREDSIFSASTGDQIVASIWVRQSVPVPRTLSVLPRSGGVNLSPTNPTGFVVGGTPGATKTAAVGQWERWSWRVTAPSAADGVQLWVAESVSGPAAGSTIDWRDVLIEVRASALGAYFDGDTADTTTYGYAWSGAAGASSSAEVALAGSVAATSAPVRLVSSDVWLTAPGLPGLDIGGVELGGKPSRISRPQPSAALLPLGATRPIVVHSVRQDATGWRLTVHTLTHAQAVALRSLVSSAGVLLIRIPGVRMAHQYVWVSDLVEDDITVWRDPAFDPNAGLDTITASASSRTVWELTCTTVDRPAGGVQGDPTASWQQVLDTWSSWSEVLARHDTWLDVLRGTPT